MGKRNPLIDPKSGDVFSRHGLHYEVDDVTPDGMQWREWHRDECWEWMSRKRFNEFARQPGVIGKTRAEWDEETR